VLVFDEAQRAFDADRAREVQKRPPPPARQVMSGSTVPTTHYASLITAPARATVGRIWRAIPVQERQKGLEALLATLPKSDPRRAELIGQVASARNFRTQSVKGWGDARLAAAAARVDLGDGTLASDSIVQLHFAERRRMMERFLTHVGVDHDN
jgi:hypothetical protein